MIRIICFVLFGLVAFGGHGRAQSYRIVPSCGAAGLSPSQGSQQGFMDTTGDICTSATGGGGGGAITAASGAYASGAIGSGAYAAGAFSVGAAVDGWNITEGTKADSAYAGSGSASIVAILKGIYNAVSGAIPAGTNTIGGVTTTPGQRTLVALDISTVTTGGTAVNALSAGHRTAGGFLQNPVGATINLCVNEIGAASGTTSSGSTTCIIPGQSYVLSPAAGAVSVVTSDSSHPFSGYGLE